MEFLSRLIGGSRAAESKKAAADNPEQRLARFKRIYNQTLQAWQKGSASKSDPRVVEVVLGGLEKLCSILQDDSRAPSPHLCLSFASSSSVYTTFSRIALSFKNDAVVRDVVALFNTLVDNDEENLLATDLFTEAVMTFADGALKGHANAVASETENDVLELIFSIAAKIKLEPELTPIWFRHFRKSEPSEKEGGKENLAEKSDFPLCRYFVSHLYQEGPAGDFARTGLLYLFEAASQASILEDWIVDSDLPTLMASGVGALYSQLSRKLTIAHPKESKPLILALSDSTTDLSSTEAESFYSSDLQTRLSTFMSYMEFWQDILEQCRSVNIKETLIDHYQIFFLQQILFPTLLESSDADGGSSVAVLTYLWRILDLLDHPELVHLVLHYLLALPGAPMISQPTTPRSPIAQRKRLSLLFFTQAGSKEDDAALAPSLFSLADLVRTSCQSSNSETVISALRLLTVLLSKHHAYAVQSLIRTTPIIVMDMLRPVGAMTVELDSLLALARDIGGEDGMDTAYDGCLKDTLTQIEAHACSRDLLRVDNVAANQEEVDPAESAIAIDGPPPMRKHRLAADDSMLLQLVTLLGTFFTNKVETNMELTSALTTLASCPYLRLEGWLVSDGSTSKVQDSSSPEVAAATDDQTPNGDTPEDAPDESETPEKLEQDRIQAFKAAFRNNQNPRIENLPIFNTLLQLSSSLQTAKSAIPEFDALLAGRKRAFLGATEFEEDPVDVLRSAAISPRLSVDLSRPSSRTRGLISTPTPSLPPQPNPREVRPTSPRGRTLTAIVGAGRLGSPASSASPYPQSFSPLRHRSTPLDSPALRAQDQSSRRTSRSPTKKAQPTLSPLVAVFPEQQDGERASSPARSAASSAREEIFERKISFPALPSVVQSTVSSAGDEVEPRDSEGPEEAVGTEPTAPHPTSEARDASLTHVLTNVVILQEFILELAAIIQVRAGLLDEEVRFV